MIEYNKEVASHEVGVHFRGVRGNSLQMLHVLEREWRDRLSNSSQNVLHMQIVQYKFLSIGMKQ